MACLVASLVTLALLIVPQVASISPASPLINEVCIGRKAPIQYDQCVENLNYLPHVVAAKDLNSLVIALADAGISRTESAQLYLQYARNTTVVKTPDFLYVMDQCQAAYASYAKVFGRALANLESSLYIPAVLYFRHAYKVDVNQCGNALISRKFTDINIQGHNLLLLMYANVACQTMYLIIQN